MLSACVIVDVQASSLVSAFWQKISALFLEGLAPAHVMLSDLDNPVELLIDNSIQKGYRKIILIGNEGTVFLGINKLMKFPAEMRKQFEVGLWPLNYPDILTYSLNMSQRLKSLTHVFKVGHTCPIVLGKVLITDSNQRIHTFYFWEHCDFSFIETSSSLKKSRTPSLFSLPLIFTPKAGHLQIEHSSFEEHGKIKVRLALHSGPLHSFHVDPEELSKFRKFTLMWQKKGNYGIRGLDFPWNAWPLKKTHFGLIKERTCTTTYVQLFDSSISLYLDGQKKRGCSAHFEIARNALPLIVNMVPFRSKETTKDVLRNIKSEGVAANRENYNQKTGEN
ncbi:MAG: hypothetical protein HQM14_07450 [SAR324 cluster bacterium]|nr:hypothetical protein [SAR324 cluster bacterium]